MSGILNLFCLIIFFGFFSHANTICESKIFCSSELLNKVQLAHLYADSKIFVDKPLKANPEEVLKAFEEEKPSTRNELEDFVDRFFGVEGEELEAWDPPDFTDNPAFLANISDHRIREFASDLNSKWKLLGRKINQTVLISADRYSLMYVPKPFIIPGGRFREFYYWDTYWIVEGLLVSEMFTTVEGILQNLLYIVDENGFVPNGGRVYYLNRSQPPLLIPMAYSYYMATGNKMFIKENIHLLSKEYEFWQMNRSVDVQLDGKVLKAYRYKVDNSEPRPESYREDYELTKNLPEEAARQLYSEIASAAESGWDFSSRWYHSSNTSLKSTFTSNVIPVDLNSFICWNAKLLSKLYEDLGDEKKAGDYRKDYDTLKETITSLFWNSDEGAWFDLHIDTKLHDKRFSASMIAPLFTGCLDMDNTKIEKFENYVKKLFGDLDNYKAGIPTSLVSSGQQWDNPNAWPPLQHMWVIGLENTGNAELIKLSKTLTNKWVISNWEKWLDGHHMYEKYNAKTGQAGGGGEYDVQTGFGWTNGVILDLLKRQPMIKPPSSNTSSLNSCLSSAITVLISFLLVI